MRDSVSTNSLMAMLQSESAQTVLREDNTFSASSFSEYLRQRMTLCGMTVPQLIATANVSKTYMYQILKEERRAGRDVVLRVAFALRCTVDETQRLLTLSSNGALYPRIRRDAALIFGLAQHMTLSEIEELLAALPERSVYGFGG